MSRELVQRTSLLRCLLVWVVATSGALALGVLAVDECARASASSFASLVTGAAAVALLGCAGWFWFAATVVIVGAVRGRRWSVLGCPDRLHRALLAGCGLVLLAGAPSAADTEAAPRAATVLAGLPLPDRPELRGPGSARGPGIDAVAVRPGDTLWSIAVRSLPAGAPATVIDRRWRGIWARNRELVGRDPDLIHPGTELSLPRKES